MVKDKESRQTNVGNFFLMESNCRVRRQSIARRTNGRSGRAPASDNAPATPHTVAAFVRLFRFEFRLPCDMMEASRFSPTLMRNYIWADARYGFRSSSGSLAIFTAICRIRRAIKFLICTTVF